MSKIRTPAMERIELKSRRGKKSKTRKYNFWLDAWRRCKRNRLAVVGLIIICLLILTAIFADYIAPYKYTAVNPSESFQYPSKAHIFGTDQIGRDIFSRCIYAARISLPMGFVCTVCSTLIGGMLGLVCAYFMGRVDNVIMRICDVFQSIPGMMLAICVVATLGTTVFSLILAITISAIPGSARGVRAAALTQRDKEFIEATKSVGASNLRLMIRHILPNCVGHLIIGIVGSIAGYILLISGLSYIGLGIQAPLPEWGSLLSTGKQFLMSYPYMVIFPGLFILVTVFAFNLFGDGVRDALDPRLK